MPEERIKVMLSGFPGKMAKLAAQTISLYSRTEIELCRAALSEMVGEQDIGIPMGLVEDQRLDCYPVAEHGIALARHRPDIIVDFTAPSAVNRNAEVYCKYKVPFVMGTTGGDRELLKKTVEQSEIPAVIAPNLAAPVVAMMAMLEFGAQNFPGLFKGWKLIVQESHQAAKKDKSGTAIKLLDFFKAMGVGCGEEDIYPERRPAVQQSVWHVPQEYLGGHGFHTYLLVSPDGKVTLEWHHDVCGRDVYAQSVSKAVKYLHKHREEKGKIFSMIDVMKDGW